MGTMGMARVVSRPTAQLEEQPMDVYDSDIDNCSAEAGRDDSEYPQHGLHLNIVGNSADGGHAPDEGVSPGSSATRTGGQTTMTSSMEPSAGDEDRRPAHQLAGEIAALAQPIEPWGRGPSHLCPDTSTRTSSTTSSDFTGCRYIAITKNGRGKTVLEKKRP